MSTAASTIYGVCCMCTIAAAYMGMAVIKKMNTQAQAPAQAPDQTKLTGTKQNKNHKMDTNNNTTFEMCCICLETYDGGGNGEITIQCGHKFHATCLQQYLSSRQTKTPELLPCCPACRTRMDEKKITKMLLAQMVYTNTRGRCCFCSDEENNNTKDKIQTVCNCTYHMPTQHVHTYHTSCLCEHYENYYDEYFTQRRRPDIVAANTAPNAVFGRKRRELKEDAFITGFSECGLDRVRGLRRLIADVTEEGIDWGYSEREVWRRIAAAKQVMARVWPDYPHRTELQWLIMQEVAEKAAEFACGTQRVVALVNAGEYSVDDM